MPHWLIKSAVHQVIALLPQRQKCNEFLQKRLTSSLDFGQGPFEAKVKSARRFLEDFLKLHPDCAEGFTAVEVGTGWYPTIPIALFLCGAKEIWTFDIDPLLSRDRMRVLLELFRESVSTGRLQELLPQIKRERLELIEAAWTQNENGTPAEALKKLGINALVRDFQKSGLPDKSIDLFFSYSVFQYIPAAIQLNIYAEFRRLASPNGTAIQYLDLVDQFYCFDRRLGPLNYMKYSARMWKLLDSPLIPQTRLQISDFRTLMASGGLQIIKESNTSVPPEELNKIRLAPEFKKYSPEDLRVISTWLVASIGKTVPLQP